LIKNINIQKFYRIYYKIWGGGEKMKIQPYDIFEADVDEEIKSRIKDL
jgi:hypothetical protein